MARALEVFRRYGAEIASLREFLNTVIDNDSVPTAIIVKDATNHRIVLVNRAVEELWGLQRAQVLGKTMYDLFPKHRADIITTRDEEVIRSGNAFYYMDAHPLAGHSEKSGAPLCHVATTLHWRSRRESGLSAHGRRGRHRAEGG
jgi:PAS domain-containing protein